MDKINKITPDKQKFLQVLGSIAKPPKVVYYRGQLPDRRVPTIAIVGSRKPSAYGKEVTEKLALDLARKGVVIVSGLALGVDAIGHRAALAANAPTIAVLASGIDAITPRSHEQLGQQIIAQGGAIISENAASAPVFASSFLIRNRLVSGLSDGVLITEAAQRSGTLSTAAHALEQGKEVFVVPGNITSPLSQGTNALLRQGATPVTSADDILEVIAPQLLTPTVQLQLGTTPDETRLIELLHAGVRDGDELQQRSNIEVSAYLKALTMLEINGVIRPLGGNQWTLR